MNSRQHILDLHDELIVDNFAGGGGASTGIFMALNRHVDHAINHDKWALGMHRINHPQTLHHCEDVFEIDPFTMCEGRKVGLGWFSPDCRHFSKAKGGKPLDKKIRGLVLVMLRWAKYGVRVMCMENVEEIQTWGPLMEVEKNGEIGWYPDPSHKGRTWKAFLACLSTGIYADHPDLQEILDVLGGTVTRAELIKGFGYKFEINEIRAYRKGAPTVRNRLFMIARCDGRPIVWPEDTHANPKDITAGSKLKPWRTIAECLDFTLPCPSIFLNKEDARKARCKRPLVTATLRRVATGVGRYVMNAAEPFLVSLTHQGGDRVEATSEPSKTITGAHRGEKAVVTPVLSGSIIGAGGPSYSGKPIGMNRPFKSQTVENHSALAQTTLTPFITEHAHATNQRNMPAAEPMRTLCAGVKGGHFALVAGTIVGAGGRAAQSRPRGLDEPMHTTTSKADSCLAAATMVQVGYGEREGQEPRVLDLQKPLGTVVAGGVKHALAAASLVKLRGDNIGSPVTEPIHTISAGGTHHGVVACYMAQHNGGFNETPGHPVDEPVSTISATGSQQNLVAANVVAYYGSETDGQGVREPGRTATTKARLGEVESTLVVPFLTPEQLAGARRVAAFLREYGVEFEGEFAMVGDCIIIDIGLRMLTPRELFLAQGFPPDYVIDRAYHIDPPTGGLTEFALTKEQQIRMCGNSVCPPVAEAIVRANCPDLIMAPVKYKKPRRIALCA